MSTEVYYFSGTGNSLFIAKRISKLLNGDLISIVSSLNKVNRISNANIIGIIFPCYLAQISGIPPIVEEFCNQLKTSSAKYIFAICTYGGFSPFNAYPTLFKLSQIFQNNKIKLSGAFSIKLPFNNLDYDHIPVPINRNHQIMFNYTEKKLNDIFQRIINRKNVKNKLLKDLFYIFAYSGPNLPVIPAETCHLKNTYSGSNLPLLTGIGCRHRPEFNVGGTEFR